MWPPQACNAGFGGRPRRAAPTTCMIEYREYPELDPRSPISCIWEMRGGGGVQRVVTDARPEIVFHLAGGFRQFDGSHWRSQSACIFAGQLTGPLFIRPANGSVDTLGIRLKSWAGSLALQDEAARATDHIVDLDSVWAPLMHRLAEAPAAQRPSLARVAVLREFAKRRTPDQRIVALAGFASACAGQTTVDDLADHAGLSPRHLDRLFYAHVGVGPKMFLRMVRFRSVFHQIDGGAPNWATIAASAGYTDQSHLIRDFRQFAGCSPGVSLSSDSDLALHFMARA